MANILAIDTATPSCSAAILVDGHTYSRYQLASRSHTALILPMVDELLKETGRSLSALDAITFTHGPGSFTGIRIGFGVVQGLAVGASLPVIPVSTLELLANTAARKLSLQPGQQIFPAFDARMSELYWGHYQLTEPGVVSVLADQLTPIDQACVGFDGFKQEQVTGAGDGWVHLQERTGLPDCIYAGLCPEAEDLLAIAGKRLARGEEKPIREVEPLYLRDTVSWKKRQWLRPKKNIDVLKS